MPTIIFAIFVFALGCCIGSFLNVCIYRMPRGLSLMHPGSHCPVCNEPISWYDNIPLLGWLQLRGLCRRCGVLISPRYILVELLTGLIFLTVYLRHTAAPATSPLSHIPTLSAYLLVAAALIAASFIDIERMVIPDEISIGGMILGPIACFVFPHIIEKDAFLTLWTADLLRIAHHAPWPDLHSTSLIASLYGLGLGAGSVYMAGVFGKMLFRKEAMGFGDVKLMGMAGAFIGWQGILLAFLVGCLAGAVIGIALLLRRRDTHIPFGPYLAIGIFIVMLFKPAVLHAFLHFPQVLHR